MAAWDKWINESTYDVFIKNTEINRDKIIIKRGLSKDILPTLTDSYDFIYIDGDHSEDAVWLDAKLSFPILKDESILIFDDYGFGKNKRSPKNAIDRFLKEYKDQIEVLDVCYQVIIKKLRQ